MRRSRSLFVALTATVFAVGLAAEAVTQDQKPLIEPAVLFNPSETLVRLPAASSKPRRPAPDACSLIQPAEAELILGPSPARKENKDRRKGTCAYQRSGSPQLSAADIARTLDAGLVITPGSPIAARTLTVVVDLVPETASQYRKFNHSVLDLRGGNIFSRGSDLIATNLLTNFVGVPLFYRFTDGLAIAIAQDSGVFAVRLTIDAKVWSGADEQAKLIYVAELITVSRQASIRFAGTN